MDNNIIARNRFCDITKVKFRKWDEIDVLYWKFGRDNEKKQNGEYYLNAYKDAYVGFNKNKIISNANAIGIPPDLLGGVAWIESGGKPESSKLYVFETRRMMGATHSFQSPGKTSFGSVAMQIDVAARMLGLDPSELSTRDQLELSNCLLEDDFNLRLAATYLREMILFDYPSAASMYLTDEQYMMAGIRYNRGAERRLEDFVKIINDNPARGVDGHDKISYGLRLIHIRPHIKKILGV